MPALRRLDNDLGFSDFFGEPKAEQDVARPCNVRNEVATITENEARHSGLTFDMRGVTRLAGARPLDGRVGRHLRHR